MFNNFDLTIFGSAFVHWKTLGWGWGKDLDRTLITQNCVRKTSMSGKKPPMNRECPTRLQRKG